jgi:nucleotide-binding universal stress UspA family protein
MKVLVGYDGSTYSELAVEDLRLAGMPRDTHAIVLSVVEPELKSAAIHTAESICNRLQALYPGWDAWLETPSGQAAAVILDRARSWHADLVTVGTHGRTALARLMLGSVSLKVAHEAGCSVRVARSAASRPDAPIRLLIGSDGSPESDAAVNEVCGRSWPAGTEARVVSVVQTLAPVDAESLSLASHSLLASETFVKADAQEHRRLKTVAEQAVQKLEQAGLSASYAVEDNDPKEVLVREARNWSADTIFVGARGLGRVERLLLGSVSTALAARAPCTVEVVRHH